jgi:peptide/nickel transport system permease protein
VAPYGANEFRTGPRLEGPTWSNWFGTDPLQRDIFSRVLAGARVSMMIGLITVGIATVVALLIALPSGYFGGWFDMLMQRMVDAFIAFPGLVFLIAVGAVF